MGSVGRPRKNLKVGRPRKQDSERLANYRAIENLTKENNKLKMDIEYTLFLLKREYEMLKIADTLWNQSHNQK